jgi:hypothetical protein
MLRSGKNIVITIFISVLFLASCIPGKELQFEYLTPAGYTLPSGSSRALIFNSSYKPGVDTSTFNILRKLDEKEQFILDTLIVNNILNGFFYITDQSPVPALKNSAYAEQRGEDTVNFLQPLSSEAVNYLLDEFSADLVISFEYFGMNYDFLKSWNVLDDPEVYLLLDRALIWRIYDRDSMIREENMRDTLVWFGSGDSFKEAEARLPSIVQVVRESFWFAGEEFAMELSPSWKDTERSYFILHDQGEERSLDPVFLRELSKDDNRIKAYKANFNLSIYHERNGNPNKALEYMNAALEIRPGATLAKYYKKNLVEKVKEFEKLKEQVELLEN